MERFEYDIYLEHPLARYYKTESILTHPSIPRHLSAVSV